MGLGLTTLIVFDTVVDTTTTTTWDWLVVERKIKNTLAGAWAGGTEYKWKTASGLRPSFGTSD